MRFATVADLWHANHKRRADANERRRLGQDHKSNTPGLDNCKGSAERQRGFEDAAAAEAASVHAKRPAGLNEQARTLHIHSSSKKALGKAVVTLLQARGMRLWQRVSQIHC